MIYDAGLPHPPPPPPLRPMVSTPRVGWEWVGFVVDPSPLHPQPVSVVWLWWWALHPPLTLLSP